MLLHEWKLEEAVAVAKREGKEDGMEEGKRQQAIHFAKKMKDKGADLNYIIEMTDLSIEEILKL